MSGWVGGWVSACVREGVSECGRMVGVGCVCVGK